MTKPPEYIHSFIDAYERANGERLDWDEARDAAHNVLSFVELLSQPASEEARIGPPGARAPRTTPVRWGIGRASEGRQ